MNFKKTLTSIIFSSVIFGVSLIAGCSSQQTIPKANSRNWDELRKVHEQVKKIRYEFEDEEYWNSPKTTEQRGYGDCDEIATFGSYKIEPLGFSPKMLVLVNQKSWQLHSLTFLEKKNFWRTAYGAFDKNFILYPAHNSIDSLVEEINKLCKDKRRYIYYAVLDLNSLNKDWRTTDENLSELGKEKIVPLKAINSLKKDDRRLYFKGEEVNGYKSGDVIFAKK